MTELAAPLSQPLYGATFGQAINRFFKKYATFTGRASLSEYWWVSLALFLVTAVLYGLGIGIGIATGTPDGAGGVTFGAVGVIFFVLLGLFSLAVVVPGIAVTVRRLHDGNFSGAFYLLSLIGLSIVVLILTLMPSKPEGARFDA
jgi:uncharacterized membrane protein YhaH (DUF805 family)